MIQVLSKGSLVSCELLMLSPLLENSRILSVTDERHFEDCGSLIDIGEMEELTLTEV